MTPEDLSPVEPPAFEPPAFEPPVFERKPPRVPVWGWADVGLFFGLALTLLLLAQTVLHFVAAMLHVREENPFLLLAAESLAYLGMFSVLAAMLRLAYDAPFWKSLGWISSRVSYVTAIATGVLLAFGVALLGGLLHVESKGSDISKLLESPQGLIVVPIFAVTVAPLCEELIFRGFLQPIMIRSIGVIAGILITSALFGMLHFQEYGRNWGAAALIGVTGLALGIIRQVSGSTRISALSHMAYNGTLFASYFLADGRIAHR